MDGLAADIESRLVPFDPNGIRRWRKYRNLFWVYGSWKYNVRLINGCINGMNEAYISVKGGMLRNEGMVDWSPVDNNSCVIPIDAITRIDWL